MSIIDKIKVREGTHEVVEEDQEYYTMMKLTWAPSPDVREKRRWPNAYAMGTRKLSEIFTMNAEQFLTQQQHSNAILESWRKLFNQSMAKGPLTGDELRNSMMAKPGEPCDKDGYPSTLVAGSLQDFDMLYNGHAPLEDDKCKHPELRQPRVDAETPQDRRDGMTCLQWLDEFDDELPAWFNEEYEIRTRDAVSGTVEVVKKEPK